MGNVVEFNRELAAWNERVLVPAAAQMQRDVLRDTAYGLIDGTPVGDPRLWSTPAPRGYEGGHAKRNWRVYLHRDYNAAERSGVDPTGSTVKDEVDIVLLLRIVRPVAFSTISNPVSYMEPLANGWSKQAPAGWIEAVVARVTQKYGRVR